MCTGWSSLRVAHGQPAAAAVPVRNEKQKNKKHTFIFFRFHFSFLAQVRVLQRVWGYDVCVLLLRAACPAHELGELGAGRWADTGVPS